MRVLVDTSVWSLAFLRKTPPGDPAVERLRALISAGDDVLLAGLVLQELLQGARSREQAARLRSSLEPFERALAEEDDHVLAAEIFRASRDAGLGVATLDALIAAMALRRQAALLTTDSDFHRIAELVPLQLL